MWYSLPTIDKFSGFYIVLLLYSRGDVTHFMKEYSISGSKKQAKKMICVNQTE